MQEYLKETQYFDFSSNEVRELALQVQGSSPMEIAQSIYYLVRDTIRYNPYIVRFGEESFKASHGLKMGESYCIPKAGLIVALCRKFGIPARLGLADVRNHLSSEKFIEMIGTDYFAMHGYAEVFIDEQWIKTTPVFNKELCEKFNVEPLEWDGKSDAVFQEFTKDGKKHMEYLEDHGTFSDVPVAFIFESFKKHYPKLAEAGFDSITAQSFEADIAD